MASGLKWNSLLYLHTTTFLSRCLAQEHKSINTNIQTHTINNTKTSAQHTSTKGSLTGSSETHYWITTTFLSHCRRDISRLKAVEGINFFSEMCPLYLCVHVFVYMWIFKVYFSTRGRSKHQLPLKNVSSPRWEALRPKFEPFFPAAAQTLSIVQHAVQTLCRISQYFSAVRISQYSTAQTLCVVFYSMRKHCCPSCLTWPKHWHTMDGG